MSHMQDGRDDTLRDNDASGEGHSQRILEQWRYNKASWLIGLAMAAALTIFMCTRILANNVPYSQQTWHISEENRSSYQHPRPMRILPIGDSITQGWASSDLNGYRKPLLDILTISGVDAEYLGTQHSGNMSNNEHEGYPGLDIKHIENKIRENGILEEHPDVVLLHAGTNDMGLGLIWDPPDGAGGDYWSRAPERLGDLLDYIFEGLPDVTILVVKILQSSLDGFHDRIVEYNDAIPDVVDARTAQGAKILLGDMSGNDVEDLVDGAHPNDEQYLMMAEIWMDGLLEAGDRDWLPIMQRAEYAPP